MLFPKVQQAFSTPIPPPPAPATLVPLLLLETADVLRLRAFVLAIPSARVALSGSIQTIPPLSPFKSLLT